MLEQSVPPVSRRPPNPGPPPPRPRNPNPPKRFDGSGWIAIGLIAVLIVVATLTAGFPGFLIMIGLIGTVTAIYSLLTMRPSWARIPSRPIATGILVACLISTTFGGSLVHSSRVIAQPGGALSSSVQPELPVPTSPPPSLVPTAAPTPPPVAEPTAGAESTDLEPVVPGSALALLETLPVKGKAAKVKYQRTEQFGKAWLDVDQNGCDTRNDILARDLTDIVLSGSCKVLSGTLDDPYTAQTIHFVRGVETSTLVHIDHVVALSNAWRTGAQQFTQDERIAFANDPLNLLAVDGAANMQKGDGDAATWLPKNKSFRCEFVARQISAKAKHSLWVVPAERDAMVRVLERCSDQPALIE